MTVLIAWASLAVGIVIGATWRSLCEKQSRRNTSLADGSMMLHRLNAETGELAPSAQWDGNKEATAA